MDLIVIRHGQSEADLLNVYEGRADYHLTPLGKKQADAMGEWVANRYHIDKIFASPMTRTKETAASLSQRVGVKVTYDEDLMEWQNGLLAGRPKDEARILYPKLANRYPHTLVYQQESDIAFRMRAETVLSKIIHEYPQEYVVAIVTHNGMITQLFRSFLKLPIDSPEVYLPRSKDTAIHVWQVKGRNRGIIHVNLQDHLQGLEGSS